MESPLDWDFMTAYWLAWTLAFFLGEYLGYREGNEMLSHHIWYIRNTGDSIVLFMMYAILAWINYHFIVEGWRLFRKFVS